MVDAGSSIPGNAAGAVGIPGRASGPWRDAHQRHFDLAFFDEFEEWLAVATFMVKEQVSREGVHASTFFLIRVEDESVLGSVQIRHSLTPELLLHGGHIGYAIRAHRARQELWQAPVDARVGGSKEAGSAAGYDIL